MKTTDVFFKDTNFVGREIENVQDLVKAVAVGMDIANYDGVGYTSGYDDEDEDGNWVWHEKTEEERFAEMRGDLDGGCELYAGFFINNREYSIKPAATTTMQTNLYVGQRVYIMHENKILKTTIAAISLYAECESAINSGDDTFLFHIESKYKGAVEDTKVTKSFAVLHGWFGKDEKGKEVKYGFVNYVRPLDEVFATKEELVKHLMQED